MKKVIKNVGIGFILLLTAAFFKVNPVYAQDNAMQRLDIHVQLLEDGTGIVTEYREMDMHEGTELYIEMNHLQDSELTNFEVNGFDYNPDWDIDESFEEKAGFYGILEDGNDYELVWGISEYGQNQYELTYTLTNLVRQLEDGQGLLWNFNTFGDIPPEELTMEIEGPVPFTEEDTMLWGFGLEGDIQLEDGQLVWQSSQALTSDNYATVLLQFPNEPFVATAEVDRTLEEQQEMALEGSSYNDEEGMDGRWIAAIVGGIAVIVAAVVTFLVKLHSAYKKAGRMKTGSELKQKNKGLMYDQAPYKEGDLADIALFLHNKFTGAFDDYFFAYLLKWAYEEKIHIESMEVKKFLGTKQDATIEILNYNEWDSEKKQSFAEYSQQVVDGKGELSYESALWKMLLESADENGIITSETIQRWAEDHADDVSDFADGLKEYSTEILGNKGYIEKKTVKFAGLTIPLVASTEKGEELADRIQQFENYLDSLDLKEAASVEQNMPWEELIIWAALFNKAEDIVKQLEEFFPDVWAEWVDDAPYFYGEFHGVYGFRQSWSNGLASGGYSASGGGGGSTSVGGGGGAGGGGGGGAR